MTRISTAIGQGTIASMKVAFVHSWNMWGGGERHTLALASVLRARGHQVWVIQSGHDQFAPYWPADHRLSIDDQRPGLTTWRRALRGIAPDVICEVRGGGLRFGGSLDLAALLLGIRSVPIEHSPYPPPPTWSNFGSRRRIPAHAVALLVHTVRKLIHRRSVAHRIAVAEHVGASASRYFDLASDDLSVIQNGVDSARFVFSSQARARIRAELGVSDRSFVVGAVGRLSNEKQLDLLLRAFSMLRHRHSLPSVLVIAGDGPAMSSLRALSTDLGIDSAVRFLGFRQDPPAVLSAIDVVVSTSGSEGLSLALLEAMATERACVCLPYEGLDEIAASNAAIRVVPSRSLTALVDAIAAMATLSPHERAALGAQGRDIVQRRFSEETQLLRLAERLEALGGRST